MRLFFMMIARATEVVLLVKLGEKDVYFAVSLKKRTARKDLQAATFFIIHCSFICGYFHNHSRTQRYRNFTSGLPV
jgi:hypothetical protein